MRRLFLGLLLLALLAGFCLWANGAIHARLDRVSDLVTQARTAAREGHMEQAADLARQAQDRWHKALPLLSALLHHQSLEELTLALSDLCLAPGDFAARSTAVLLRLRRLADFDALAPENLF